MEIINELKAFDSLNNEWKTIGSITSDREYETSMHGDDKDVFGFEGVYFRNSRRGKGDDAYFNQKYNETLI